MVTVVTVLSIPSRCRKSRVEWQEPVRIEQWSGDWIVPVNGVDAWSTDALTMHLRKKIGSEHAMAPGAWTNDRHCVPCFERPSA